MAGTSPSRSVWSVSAEDAVRSLDTTAQGLSSDEAAIRIERYAASRLQPKKRTDTLGLLIGQFSSPIGLMLVAAALISVLLHDSTDAFIILAIVLASGLLGFWQERGAAGAVEKLLGLVEVKATVLRQGVPVEVSVQEVVPGDVVVLAAGATAPGDCRLLEARDLYADEATLTGETFPAEKSVGVLPVDAPLARRTNCVFLGTHIVSGSGTALVVAIGKETEFGKVSERLKLRPPETDFERGVRRFGYLLMEITLLLVICIFALNVYLQRPVLDSLLFSMALAVGLTPQLLPAIVSINLAAGARRMAAKKVIVKRLASIENFGSMNVLCTDKTGTLTEGKVRLQSVRRLDGSESPDALLCVYLNSSFETGFASPIDAAVRDHCQLDISAWKKLDEVPYDFIRKRLTVLVAGPAGNLMITKGALANVLEACTTAELADGTLQPLASVREEIDARFAGYSADGQRTLGLARKAVAAGTIGKVDETAMTFLGFVLFSDPLKPGIAATIGRLRGLGVDLKVITGDNALVAAAVARQIGFTNAQVLSGIEMKAMSDGALLHRVGTVDVFAEIEPNEKERIIRALRKAGNVVGYLGDGINDASALHAADVGLSVDSAVDVAKEVADIVLLDKDLEVLIDGVREGRVTFANTLKYVLIATSANFGNMFSMAGASLILPFLPLLPKQILLTNMLTDLPAMTISGDSVDDAMLSRPRRWDIGFIRSFMLAFGVLSSVFDYLTFGVLLILFHANTDAFRTAWFVESVISAALILLVVRSRRPLFGSAPSGRLVAATLAVVVLTLALPFMPFARFLGFTPLPLPYFGAIALIVGLYIGCGELAKRFFYRRFDRAPAVTPLVASATVAALS